MPYHWSVNPSDTLDSARYTAHIRPHRSLSARGFSIVIWLLFAGITLPLLPFIGSTAFWVLLAFMMAMLGAVWVALRRSDRDKLREELHLSTDQISLTHTSAKGKVLNWKANPYWTVLTQHPEVNGIENYLTLRGGGPEPGREVELGAFLSAQEREHLYSELSTRLAELRSGAQKQ